MSDHWCESCGAPASIQVPGGQWWCQDCDRAHVDLTIREIEEAVAPGEETPVSPVPWRIVKLERRRDPVTGIPRTKVTAEAPPEVVPAVWTHEGCELCGGSGTVCLHAFGDQQHLEPCPDGRLVPWKGEEE